MSFWLKAKAGKQGWKGGKKEAMEDRESAQLDRAKELISGLQQNLSCVAMISSIVRGSKKNQSFCIPTDTERKAIGGNVLGAEMEAGGLKCGGPKCCFAVCTRCYIPSNTAFTQSPHSKD